MDQSTLYIVAAPSGAGKTSLINALVHQIDDLKVSISHTTRPQRPGEVDAEHYYFIDKARFEKMVQEKKFFEYAMVYEHYYGTSRHGILEQLSQGQDIILEIDWQGAAQIRRIFAQTVSVFIFPPSLKVLYERLKNRQQDKPTVIEHRMRDAIAEMRHYREFDYLVVNQSFEKALSDLLHIVHSVRLRSNRESKTLSLLVDNLLQKQ